MSELKTPITALNEYCQRKNAPPPHYTVSDFKNKSNLYTCIIRAFYQEAEGTGISRQIAKQDAASNILKKLEQLHSDLGDLNVLHQTITTDYMLQLANFCMEHKHPYPSAEITDESGPPNSRIFTALCRVGSIVAEATGISKSAAKQLAAQKVFNVVKNLTPPNNVVDVDKKMQIKKYREITNKSSTDMCLQNRHNYFKDMPPDIKEAAWKILNDCTIQCSKTKVELILNAMGLKYKKSIIRNKRGVPWSFIELVCDLDVVFVNSDDKIFVNIIEYLRDMLK